VTVSSTTITSTPLPHEVGGEPGKAFDLSVRPTIVDRDVAAFDPSKFAQPLPKGCDPSDDGRSSARAHDSDGRQLPQLLRWRCERPLGRAAEQRNQVAAVHVASRAKEHPITSLNDCGVVHYSEIKSSMSQMGQSRALGDVHAMSGLPAVSGRSCVIAVGLRSARSRHCEVSIRSPRRRV
jgi:hypothetical protein